MEFSRPVISRQSYDCSRKIEINPLVKKILVTANITKQAFQMNNNKITQLNRDLARIKSEKHSLGNQLAELNTRASELKLQRDKIIAENKRKNDKITVSDHAIIRYLERVMGYDIENIRERILSDPVRDSIKLGANSVKTAEATFVVHDNVIVTVKT